MGDKVWIQCQNCGHLHKAKIQLSEDDLYIYEYCPKCRDETKSLYCGEDETEIYIYYNANLDTRYF
jgi:Zn finger protein HypA/HybF involved in hydrogenase expression